MSSDGQPPASSGSNPAASSSSQLPAAPSLVGEVIDRRWKIFAKLGEGGMGEVYAAEHIHIQKKVAIKLLRPEIVSNKEAVSRFKQEAHSSSSIGHNNIIKIEDFFELPDGRVCMCMEFLDGAPLNKLLEEAMPIDRLLNILIQTGHGLAAAHAAGKGIVHRDMKPENIFVTHGPSGEDIPKILDFGIAKVAGNDGQNNLTRTGTIFGTPFYMAPEQALGQSVDARADIYAMGVIMYEAFGGSLPFQGESFMGILTQHITTEPEPVTQRAAKSGRFVPPALAEIIGHAMQKDPERRYRTMDEMVTAMVTAYRGLAGSGMSGYMEAYAPPPGRPTATGRGVASGVAVAQTVGVSPPMGTPMPRPQSAGMPPQGGMPHPGMQHHPGTPYPPSAPYPAHASVGDSSWQAPKKSKVPLIIVLLLLFAGGGAAAFVLLSKDQGGAAAAGSGGAVAAGADGAVAAVTLDAATAAASPDAGAALALAVDAAAVVVVDAGQVTDNVDAAVETPTAKPVTVLIAANASSAIIYVDDKSIGKAPQIYEVIPGQPVTIVLKARGYKEKTQVIDGSKTKVEVKMDRIPKPPGVPTGPKVDCSKPENFSNVHCLE